MTILVIAEHDGQAIKQATQQLITFAASLKEPIHLLIIGQVADAALKVACALGVARVLFAKDAVYQHQLPENSACLIQSIAKAYTTILAPATTFGKNLLPRVAALLNVPLLSDVIAAPAKDTFVRPIYAGNILETIQLQSTPFMLTVRVSAFQSALLSETVADVQVLDQVIPNTLSEFQSLNTTKLMRPELSKATIIVSGGRGLKSKEAFSLVETLADALHASVGASRAAVDAGWVPNDFQVGQTGKVVAPKLYIALGISGAIQHLAGMKDSRVIVAINIDPEAPIFKSSDYYLVGDVFKIVPELVQALQKVL